MRIAIEGCCHGQLDDIYGTIRLLEQREGYKIDLLLICGDFQAIRNRADLQCMSVPDKFKELGTFWKYYSGKVQAPYPTIFIGGNHEASNYLWELYHGGWVCDNIYYLGHAGVINFGGLRIGGISGISKGCYQEGHFERSPYDRSQLRTAYHVREYDVKKLLSVSDSIDIFLSHDWPRGVERYGNLNSLLRRKNLFVEEVLSNSLGSRPNELLLSKLQPSYWFAAHLHIHYAALVNHDMYKNGIIPAKSQEVMKKYEDHTSHTDEPHERNITHEESSSEMKITVEEDKDVRTETVNTSDANTKYTKFLSLDKCLPKRTFLQVVEIPTTNDETGNYDFYYDMEWLAITRATHPYLSTTRVQTPLPSDDQLKAMIEKEKTFLEDRLQKGVLDLKIPHNFEPTAPAHQPDVYLDQQTLLNYQYPFLNPQTAQFCKEIDIQNKVNPNERTHIQTVDQSVLESQPEPSHKKLKVEAIESEITIDEDEFL